jgi:hypothetical protein
MTIADTYRVITITETGHRCESYPLTRSLADAWLKDLRQELPTMRHFVERVDLPETSATCKRHGKNQDEKPNGINT